MKIKITYYNLGIISVCLFLFSMLISGYLLYNLPVAITTQVKSLDPLQLQQLSKIVGKLSLVVGTGLASALVAILFLLVGSKSEALTENDDSDSSGAGLTRLTEETPENEVSTDAYSSRLQKIEQSIQAQSGKNPKQGLERALRTICTELEACQGALFLTGESEGKHFLEFCAGYAFHLPETQQLRYEFGEGLAGQVAKEGKCVNLASVPDNYMTILSGLGKSSPNHLLLVPIPAIEANAESPVVLGVMEVASFRAFTASEEAMLERIARAFAQLIRQPAPVQEKTPTKTTASLK